MQPNDRTEATLPDAEPEDPSRPGPNTAEGLEVEVGSKDRFIDQHSVRGLQALKQLPVRCNSCHQNTLPGLPPI
jgi:hypothetical protein